MSYRKLVKKIPTSLYEKLSDRFMDALLEAKEGGKVPSAMAKAILYQSKQDQLKSEAGLVNLFEALAVADSQRAVSILEELGLKEAALALRPAEE